MSNTNTIAAIILLLLIIFVGVVFDVIGTASTAADESPFHSMAAGNVKYAHNAIYIVRNAEKVACFCNDVTGDIIGILSGTFATVIVNKIAFGEGLHIVIHSVLAAIAAALTIGGKGIGKTIALTNSNQIVYIVAVILKTIGINLKNKPVKQVPKHKHNKKKNINKDFD